MVRAMKALPSFMNLEASWEGFISFWRRVYHVHSFGFYSWLPYIALLSMNFWAKGD